MLQGAAPLGALTRRVQLVASDKNSLCVADGATAVNVDISHLPPMCLSVGMLLDMWTVDAPAVCEGAAEAVRAVRVRTLTLPEYVLLGRSLALLRELCAHEAHPIG